MPDPLPISKETIPRAMERAEHYRLLNEPAQAESICRDVVAVDPDNEKAWVHLLLSLTDQLPTEQTDALDEANRALEHIKSEYLHAYYQGIIYERWGRANLGVGHGHAAGESWIRQAMQSYDKARSLAPPDDPDPTLRWNTCARLLNKLEKSRPLIPNTPPRDVLSEYDEVPPSMPD